MKKSLLSVVLCVALLITAMGTMLAMPASAASGVDYFVGTNNANAEGVDYTVENGVLTFNATAAGQEVALVAETPANINTYPFLELEITSTGAFDLCFHDKNNDKWIGGASDYCTTFNEGATDYEKIPAGTYSTKLDLSGAYRWNPATGKMDAVIPANAEICQVIFIAEEPGTITVTKCQITDGIVDVDLNSRGDVSDLAWDKTIDLLGQVEHKDCPAPSADDPQSSVKVTKNDDGSVTFGNTNGMWPSAAYTFAEPIVVNKSAAIEVDFTVTTGSNTTIYIFMGPCTPDDFGEGAYVYIANPDDILTTDLGSGNYKGIIFLEDTINKTVGNLDAVDKCFDENGNYVITGVKVFGTNNSGATDNAVTVRSLKLLALNDDAPMPSTTKKEDRTTTTTLGQATQGANGNTTTVNNGGSNAGGNSASTGDVSEAALFIVVAAAAVAVVTLSVVSKKAKSR